MKYASCPLCHLELKRENYLENDTRCNCGWSANKEQQKRETRAQEFIALQLLLVGLAFIGLITSSLYINTLEGEIEFNKLMNKMELHQLVDNKRLALLCQKAGDQQCAEENFIKVVESDPSYVDALIQIARIKRENGQLDSSMDFYFKYLESPGADIDRLIEVADTLNAIGKLEHAIQMYKKAINDVDGLVNVSATKGLVRLYMSSGDKGSAIQAIKKFNERTQSANDFFSKELMTLRNM